MAFSYAMFWEFSALVMITVAMGALLLPVMDEVFMKKEPREIVIRISMKEAGGFDPDIIRVKKGEKVKLTLIALDVTHGFIIDGLIENTGPISPDLKKGYTIEFTAPEKEGVYTFRCTVLCSPQHPFLTGILIVER